MNFYYVSDCSYSYKMPIAQKAKFLRFIDFIIWGAAQIKLAWTFLALNNKSDNFRFYIRVSPENTDISIE